MPAIDPYDQAAELVRARDRDRYLADLFASPAARRHLFALHAFAADVARIPYLVSDATIGEIRLRWWRDAINSGESGGHPIATALIATMREFSLPPVAFEMLADARIVDLYDDPMPTMDDLEGYAGETQSSLFQLAAMILGGGRDPRSADAAGHGGVAETIAAVLRGLASDPRRSAKYVPDTYLAKHGADRSALAARQSTPAVLATLADLREVARRHLSDAWSAVATLPAAVAPAFLPLKLAEARLALLERRAADPFSARDISPLRRQWILWRAARRGLSGG